MAKRHGGSEPLKKEEKRSLNKANLRHLAGVFKYMLPYKGLFIVGLVSLALSSITILAFPRLSGELLDVAKGEGKYFNSINQVALGLLGILLIQSFFSFLRVYTFSIVSEKGIANLRKSKNYLVADDFFR
jgi:ATP-binding cassette, subfamily B, bacterial